jgi:ribosomal-protein-alanine N-acetyltransferase
MTSSPPGSAARIASPTAWQTGGWDHPVRVPSREPWREALPTLRAHRVTVRELEVADAPSLLVMLGDRDVARFLAPPPSSVAAFEEFVRWTHRRRAEGAYVCFGIVPSGCSHAVGFVQVRALEADFRTAEWGFALGRPYWSTGTFHEAATRVIDFAFDVLGVERLQARSAHDNHRCHAALRRLGATRMAVLRGAFEKDGEYQDEVVWSLRPGIRRRDGGMQKNAST